MATDTRDLRAIQQIACPKCGADRGLDCGKWTVATDHAGYQRYIWQPFQRKDGRPMCHGARRKANQKQHSTGE